MQFYYNDYIDKIFHFKFDEIFFHLYDIKQKPIWVRNFIEEDSAY